MIQMLHDNVAVYPIEVAQRGTVLTVKPLEQTIKCIVVACGPGKLDNDGMLRKAPVNVGDIAYIQMLNLKNSSVIEDDGGKYNVIQPHEILCWECN